MIRTDQDRSGLARNDDVDEEMVVSVVNFLVSKANIFVSEASMLSTFSLEFLGARRALKF